MISEKIIYLAAALILLAAPASAVECHSVGGHLHGEPVSAIRNVTVTRGNMTLSGSFNGSVSPPQSLACVVIATGLFCERSFGPVNVTGMTNGSQMIETVTDKNSGQEQAGVAYVCDGIIR